MKEVIRPERSRRILHPTGTKNERGRLTNNFELPAPGVAAIYKNRWKIELFFKWIKQNLRIKAFYGASENAV